MNKDLKIGIGLLVFMFLGTWLCSYLLKGLSVVSIVLCIDALIILCYFCRNNDEPVVVTFGDVLKLNLYIVFVFILTTNLLINLPELMNDESTLEYLKEINENKMLYVLLSLFVAPLCEEIIFRRFLFRGIRQHFNFLISSVIISVIFVISHGTMSHIVVLLGSLFLCYAMEKYNSVMICGLLHFVYNLCSLLIKPELCHVSNKEMAFVLYAFGICFVFWTYFKGKK